MKKLFYITLSLILMLGATSCENWLDVNTNPNSPNNESATVDIRLPWIQYYYSYAYGSASVRGTAFAHVISHTTRTNGAIANSARWDQSVSPSTTPYQNWFIGAACNIPDLINKAEKEGSYHYIGVAHIIKAMGSIMMADLYGEMPYTEAVGPSFAPAYDNGDYIYEQSLLGLDEGIKYLQMTQELGSTPLSAGDCWCGGDTQKWIKLAYGLKARWLGNLSKTDQYDPQAILDAINNSVKSNSENVKITHGNVENAETCITVGDAYGPSIVWDTAAWGTSQRLCKYYVDLLTNFRGSGVEDPRADKLLPSAMYKVKLGVDGQIVSYEWIRTHGIDLYGPEEGWIVDRYTGGNLNAVLTYATADARKAYANTDIVKYYESVDAFVTNVEKFYPAESATIAKVADSVIITYHAGAMYVNDTNPLYVEDIKHVQLAADALFENGGLSKTDMNCYRSNSNTSTRNLGYVQGTGGFYTRPDSDTDILTYSEMCFLKAEVLFRQGDKAGAYTAYKEGITSHFARMNEKLALWDAIGCSRTAKGYDVSFAYAPMAQADIDAYMASAAVAQSSADLEMADIMLQKLIAMGFNFQNWNDLRRFNYNNDNLGFGVVYDGMKVPAYRTFSSATYATDPDSDMYYPRRYMQCSYETGYNSTNCNASVKQYEQYGVTGATAKEIFSIPVWWDWTK